MENHTKETVQNNTITDKDLEAKNHQESMYAAAAAFVAQMTSYASSFSIQQKNEKCFLSSPFLQNAFSENNQFIMPIKNSKQCNISNSSFNFLPVNLTPKHDIMLPSTPSTSITTSTNPQNHPISFYYQSPVNSQAQSQQQWQQRLTLRGKTELPLLNHLNFNPNAGFCGSMSNSLLSMQMSSSMLPFPIVREDDGVIDNPQVELEDKHLWDTFSSCVNEMIITKSGR